MRTYNDIRFVAGRTLGIEADSDRKCVKITLFGDSAELTSAEARAVAQLLLAAADTADAKERQ